MFVVFVFQNICFDTINLSWKYSIGEGFFYVFVIGFHDNKSDTLKCGVAAASLLLNTGRPCFKLNYSSKFLHEILTILPLLLEPPKSHHFSSEFIFGMLYFSRSKNTFTPFVIKDKVLKKFNISILRNYAQNFFFEVFFRPSWCILNNTKFFQNFSLPLIWNIF